MTPTISLIEQMDAEEYCTEEGKKPTSFNELSEDDQQEMLSAACEIATSVSLEV